MRGSGLAFCSQAYSVFGSKRFTNETTNSTTGTTPIPEVTFDLRYPGQY